MAVEKYLYADAAGLQTLSTTLFKGVNTRIAERIATAVTNASYADDDHVLSAKAMLGIIGNLTNYAIAQGESGAMDGTEETVLGKLKALQLAIGTAEDAATDETVYGAIAAVEEEISSLTHLTYQEVTGDIETEVPTAQAKTDVIYLQHDEPRMHVANDGFLMADDTHRAHAVVDEVDYYGWVNEDGDVMMVTEDAGVYSVTENEWPADGAIFDEVEMLADGTYNLYIAKEIKTGEVVTDIDWICVGDTSLDLSNYWSKKDSDVNELKNKIVGSLSDASIISRVEAAFTATDPYANNGANYLTVSQPGG